MFKPLINLSSVHQIRITRIHFRTPDPSNLYITLIRFWLSKINSNEPPDLFAETEDYTPTRDRPRDDITSEMVSLIRKLERRGITRFFPEDYITDAPFPEYRDPGENLPDSLLITLTRLTPSHIRLPKSKPTKFE